MTLTASAPRVALVGATGAVGLEMLVVLEQRRFPLASLRLFASPRSAGKRLEFRGQSLPVEPLGDTWPDAIDVALFSAGSGVSKRLAPQAVAAGTLVVDNSSAFRADPGCPLIVPEINAAALARALDARPPASSGRPRAGLIAAVPNCSAIIMLVALDPLRRAFGVRRVVVSTYQAASGAGAQAMDELRTQTRLALDGAAPDALPRTVFTEPYAFNLFSHNASIDPASGYNGEELKMIAESRRIWDDPGLLVSPTCVRVPTMRAHAESLTVTLARPATHAQIRAAYEHAPSVRLVDDRAANAFPTPLKATGGDDVLVGRLRPDIARLDELHPAGTRPGGDTACDQWSLFVTGDQLRTGAALTAVKIAEAMIQRA